MASNSQVLSLKTVIKAHSGWITGISTPDDVSENTFVTSSRDKSLIFWRLTSDDEFAVPVKSLTGHSQAIQDCKMSQDGCFALSASWDKTLRLWDLKRGISVRTFTGHTSDVFSCAFSPDNRQIVSGSRDKTLKLWNTLAECKFTVNQNGHDDWVTCVRFSPSNSPLVVSCGCDKLAKVWDMSKCQMAYDLIGHTAALNTVAISPDGSLCASGGRDGNAMLWDANEGRYLANLEANSSITSLCFSPCKYWLCAGTNSNIQVWSLESNRQKIAELNPIAPINSNQPWCTALQWNKQGDTLYAGTSAGEIYVFQPQ